MALVLWVVAAETRHLVPAAGRAYTSSAIEHSKKSTAEPRGAGELLRVDVDSEGLHDEVDVVDSGSKGAPRFEVHDLQGVGFAVDSIHVVSRDENLICALRFERPGVWVSPQALKGDVFLDVKASNSGCTFRVAIEDVLPVTRVQIRALPTSSLEVVASEAGHWAYWVNAPSKELSWEVRVNGQPADSSVCKLVGWGMPDKAWLPTGERCTLSAPEGEDLRLRVYTKEPVFRRVEHQQFQVPNDLRVALERRPESELFRVYIDRYVDMYGSNVTAFSCSDATGRRWNSIMESGELQIGAGPDALPVHGRGIVRGSGEIYAFTIPRDIRKSQVSATLVEGRRVVRVELPSQTDWCTVFLERDAGVRQMIRGQNFTYALNPLRVCISIPTDTDHVWIYTPKAGLHRLAVVEIRDDAPLLERSSLDRSVSVGEACVAMLEKYGRHGEVTDVFARIEAEVLVDGVARKFEIERVRAEEERFGTLTVGANREVSILVELYGAPSRNDQSLGVVLLGSRQF